MARVVWHGDSRFVGCTVERLRVLIGVRHGIGLSDARFLI